ncbi:MAG: hypothetical protein PHC62_00480 [Candidatus Izemoplasmatales bacterium]|nr:hypothetical protein [Candidatus Izemoplasmatales bacterium]
MTDIEKEMEDIDNHYEKYGDNKLLAYLTYYGSFENDIFRVSLDGEWDGKEDIITIHPKIYGKSKRYDISAPTQEELKDLIYSQGFGPEVHHDLRFCSWCGSPMMDGYTDEDMYLCSSSEFTHYMNQLYGDRNWRGTTQEEQELNMYENVNYVELADDENGEEVLIPLAWYWTEW